MHRDWIVALLAVVVIGCWIGTLGAWKMREPTQSLHYLSLPATLGAIFLAIAVLLETGWTSTTAKTFVICLVLIGTNSVGTHATARAIRMRQLGHWEPRKEDGVEFIPGEKEK